MAYCIDCRDEATDLTLVVLSAEEALEEIDCLRSRGFDVERVSTIDGAPVTLFELRLLAVRSPIILGRVRERSGRRADRHK